MIPYSENGVTIVGQGDGWFIITFEGEAVHASRLDDAIKCAAEFEVTGDVDCSDWLAF
jgi:hypothetical protein